MHAIERNFLEAQWEEIVGLANESDIFDVRRLDLRTYLFRYACKGLVSLRDGDVREHEGFLVACHLHEDYVRAVVPPLVLNLVEPRACWHPNVRAPLMCVGAIVPGTPLTELAMRAYELIAYQNFGASERDALQPDACRYVRANLDRFPTDARALKWRRGDCAPPGALP